jgi:O-antigen ligase
VPIEPASRRVTIALIVSAFLIPLLFITGSRAGLVVGAFGIVLSAPLYWLGAQRSPDAKRNGHISTRRVTRLRPSWLIGALTISTVLGLSALTILLGRAEAFQRILAHGGTEDARFQRWPSVVAMIGDYFPVGSGLGSFTQVYNVVEPRALLDFTFFNHAHNDYLELLSTGGLPALLMLIYAAGLVLCRVYQMATHRGSSPGGMLLAQLGIILIMLLALASIADYPLRTPTLSALFTLAALWAAHPLRSATQNG